MTNAALAFWIADMLNLQFWLSSPLTWIAMGFQLWMLIDAIRREEWMWVVFIVVFPFLNAILYYLLVYRGSTPAVGGFELPGRANRQRIKQLEAQIHHLDKAHHHAELGDVYFHQGKLEKAEHCYRAAIERDPEDIDTRAHLGRTLLPLGKAQEALPLLEGVCQQNPKHDYGYSLMALAEAYSVLGNKERAVQTWQTVTENYSYAQARVELAELYLAAGEPQLARAKLQEAVADDVHAPEFERRIERVWIKRARKLLAKLP